MLDKGKVTTPATAGWGVQVFFGGPVMSQPGPQYDGAERCTNNTAEATALLRIIQWGIDNHRLLSTLVIHYDSEYAMNVAIGRWRVLKNRTLAKNLKSQLQILQTRVQVQWRWVRGHTGNAGNEAADQLANRGRQGEHIPLPTFSQGSKKRLTGKQPRLAPLPAEIPDPALGWKALAQAMVSSAELVVGRKPNTGLWSPYTPQDRTTLQQLDQEVSSCFHQVQISPTVAARTEALTNFRQAKRRRANFKWGCRKRWMQFIVSQLHEAMDCHDMGSFYKLLKQIGVSATEHSREGQETFSLSALRAQAMSSAGVVDDISEELITRVVPSLPCDQSLADPPSEQEILTALHSIKDTAPGSDEVTLLMLRESGPRALWQLRLILHQMWTTDSSTWDHLSMQGLAVALYKGTGDRSRTFVLLFCFQQSVVC